MHEEALLRDLRRKVEEVARHHEAVKVSRVRLWVGALAHVTGEQLRARWDETMRGTVAEGSHLEMERSTDTDDPQAQDIVLKSLDIAPGPAGGSP